MKTRDFFPLGIASGDAFCNRVAETKWLLDNINSNKHSLLISPRRYGKTSLAYKVIRDCNLPYIEIDFAMSTNDQKVEEFIVKGITTLIDKALGPVDRIFHSIKNYVTNLTPKIVAKLGAIALELEFQRDSDPAVNVMEALTLLERLLAERQKTAVMLCDEFQAVGLIAKGKGIEAAIRHVAQETKYLTMIFSGSDRTLLKSMFEDEARPLYKLCKQLYLERIGYEDYQQHLNKAAIAQWGQELDAAVIRQIINLTAMHPYYMNKFCDIVWTECGTKTSTSQLPQLPQLDDVQRAWEILLNEERGDIQQELSLLPIGQKKVLSVLAQGITSNLTSRAIAAKIDMSPSSIAAALNALEEKDTIEQQKENGYRIINPTLAAFIVKNLA